MRCQHSPGLIHSRAGDRLPWAWTEAQSTLTELRHRAKSGLVRVEMDPRLLTRLREPDCYPNHPESVEIIQTHLSVVCLAGDAVYKLKKPVRFSFVDFSTLEKRKYFCEEELRLNQRLCPSLYREVVPLFQTGEGHWSFAEKSDTIADYAVLMGRLPQELMMDEALERGDVSEDQIREIATTVSRFHHASRQETGPLPEGIPDNLRKAVFGNFEATESLRGGVFDPDLYETLFQAVEADFSTLYPKMQTRERQGRTVDGHGDLHARNICLTTPVSIFDCIEFNPGFRIVDQATENAFMMMDLIHRGYPHLARLYLETYCEASQDEGQQEVLPSLISYRALVRAKVNALTASDKDVARTAATEARVAARSYMRLGATALLSHQRWFLMACGLPGSGKTYVFEQLSQESGWPCIATDRIRKELAGVSEQTRLPDSYYTPEFSERTYAELLRRASLTVAESPVLLDANFLLRESRQAAIAAAREQGGQPVIIWFRPPEEVVRERLAERSADETAVSDADFTVYQKLKAMLEPPGPEEGIPVLELTGDEEAPELLDKALTWLLKLARGLFPTGQGDEEIPSICRL